MVCNFFFYTDDFGTQTVDTYDHSSERWSQMPPMQIPRSYHASIAVGNKLYMMEENTNLCEVYDRMSDKFVLIKSTMSYSNGNLGIRSVWQS